MEELERGTGIVLARYPFLRTRAAALKVALALRAVETARSAPAGEPGLARTAYESAARQLMLAREAAASGDATDLGARFGRELASQAGMLQAELDRAGFAARERERTRAELALAERARRVPRDWRKVWARPAPGTTFHVEVYRRMPVTSAAAIAAVGVHPDGHPLVPVDLLRFRVLPAEGVADEGEAPFALGVESLAFAVEEVERDVPPDARLVPKERGGDGVPRRWLLVYGPALEFKRLVEEPAGEGGEARAVVTEETLAASRELPVKQVPYYLPGMNESWEQDEKLLWPYGPGAGVAVRQEVHWTPGGKWPGDEADLSVGAAWFLRYRSEPSVRYEERIVQRWELGSPWWSIYDDGVLYFRRSGQP
jgi:hypothetical protein